MATIETNNVPLYKNFIKGVFLTAAVFIFAIFVSILAYEFLSDSLLKTIFGIPANCPNNSIFLSFILLVVLPIGIFATLFFLLVKNLLREKFERAGAIVAIVIFIIITLLISLTSLNSARTRAPDTKRIADIRGLQAALEVFFNKNSQYPKDAEELLQLVTTGLIPALPPAPDDECNNNTEPYRYFSNIDGTTYVLHTKLKHDNTALQKDLDGAQLGQNCDDPYYCIGPQY